MWNKVCIRGFRCASIAVVVEDSFAAKVAPTTVAAATAVAAAAAARGRDGCDVIIAIITAADERVKAFLEAENPISVSVAWGYK